MLFSSQADLIKTLLISALATAIPSPFDFIHFYIQNYLYENEPSRAIYEILQLFDWYVLDSLWFLLLIGIVVVLNIQNVATANIITIIATLTGLGAVIGIITRFLIRR